ncbi:MAG: c-type cytochrome [Acidobacteria bacterium]|nr:c-type cytochrome [Acidobacteriota bacterium]
MTRLSMLIDLTRCIGCDACTVSCKQENGTPADVFFARVLNVEAGTFPQVKRVYVPVLCNHCEDPACLRACPNKAIYKRPDGIVLIDQDRCRGTGACVSACPYGNIILKPEDKWYLPEDRGYESDFVKPRLNNNVARKCTLCAQRVDQGLEPACVVACPTTARIFGDLDDPESKISRYVEDQKDLTDRDPFKLLPECGTKPATLYLGTMAEQAVECGDATAGIAPSQKDSHAGLVRSLLILLLFLLTTTLKAQAPAPPPTHAPNAADIWAASSCAGCHGQTAMGGLGPPLAGTQLPPDKFLWTVRNGKGMMPAIPKNEMSDEDVARIYAFARSTKLDPAQIPISFKVGQIMSVERVGMLFGIIALISIVMALWVLLKWVDRAGFKGLRPYLGKFGYGKAASIVVRSLFLDGLLVGSLWKKSKFRWAMHGLMIYGFTGLWVADALMGIFNPMRQTLPLTHPLKILVNLSGLMLLAGIGYVRFRYWKDEYIDNGLTLGRDFLFLNLLGLTVITGFLVQLFRYQGAILFIQPFYLLHLVLVAALFLTAPFTRFAHAFVVPTLVALTRLTEAITVSGQALGFAWEPAPGRHHKSERIAEGVLKAIDPAFEGKIRLRYFP